MGPTRPTMQQLIQRRRRAGFVGRAAERAAFRTNLDLAPEDERHRFLFHVHGNAGVGKTFLLRELEQLARERGALTAWVDESAGSVPEALAVIGRQFAAQGRRCKELDRLLAAHRERRHEAETAVLTALAQEQGAAGDDGPSAGSTALVRAGVAGLGTLPGVGPFVGVLDTDRLARAADQLWAGLSTRFRSHEDMQLVLSPERVLTPVLLEELTAAAAAVPWIVLFFDTYERTGPFLDGWLHEVMTTDRHGGLPDTVVVVTAGQRPFDTARWGAFADFMTDLPLEPFTEAEARGLLADRGVVSEPVVAEVLRLTGGLPVLVSTLAESRPATPDGVGDPSATAVERFLRWERDPERRSAALACALPRRLDADVFRAVTECPEDRLDSLYGWLIGLPFVRERGNGAQYHDVVRAPMLRLQRRRSPREWTRRQRLLADAYGGWREELGAGRDVRALWRDEAWRELRLAETYHLLCAGEGTALPRALRDFVLACDIDEVTAGRWAGLLTDAGQDAGAQDAARWGSELSAALTGTGTYAALGLLLRRAVLDEPAQAIARVLRGDVLRGDGAYEEALAEYDRAVTLDPALAWARRRRALVRRLLGDHDSALADLDRAVELEPDYPWNVVLRGEHHRMLHHHEEAVRDLTEGIRLDPHSDFAYASRGAAYERHGDLDEALADLDRAVELNPDYAWALARRARVWRKLGDPARQLADLDRALALNPDWAWGRCERGDALRVAGRDEEAVADYDRALALDPAYASAYASRGASLAALGRHAEAVADYDRALSLRPGYEWALDQRARLTTARRTPSAGTAGDGHR
ncbi:hypothetical protein GCM10010129_52460 [Streptomyces fumigatiscleroticus]|nr:hypothetical protein GCM10010129_52460 [Streptomyces fumigatiscleroticus]